MKNRWKIERTKKKIVSYDFEGHSDHLEMSGEQVSGVVEYGVNGGSLSVNFTAVYPNFRVQPNLTKSHLMLDIIPELLGGEFEKVEFDGNLSFTTNLESVKIKYTFFPSVKCPVFYEQIMLINNGEKEFEFEIEKYKRLDNRFCCEGFAYIEQLCEQNKIKVRAGESKTVVIAYLARYANQEGAVENNPLVARNKRIKQLTSVCEITTGDKTLDTLAHFCKLRVGESIFNSEKGYINSPGGKQYYVGAWTNDTSQYATPFYAYSTDKTENLAVFTGMDFYEPFMNDIFEPIPSSIICGGTDYWNMRRDRGDAAMFLSGNSRYFLIKKQEPSQKYLKMLQWCADFTERQIMDDGVVFSDTDEMEYRLTAGINLSTSAISYGAFDAYATLLERMGKDEQSKKYRKLCENLKIAIDKYFGNTVSGYKTYDYHKDCGEIRAWICLPSFYGIHDRTEQTIKAIDNRLFRNSQLYSCEKKEEMWDRSGLYYFSTLFRSGYSELGYKRLKQYSKSRLLGEHVPYPIERLPEGYHLSDEGALYNRIFIEGILNITFTKDGALLNPQLPKMIKSLSIKRIFLSGKLRDITVKKGEILVKTYKEGVKTYKNQTSILI